MNDGKRDDLHCRSGHDTGACVTRGNRHGLLHGRGLDGRGLVMMHSLQVITQSYCLLFSISMHRSIMRRHCDFVGLVLSVIRIGRGPSSSPISVVPSSSHSASRFFSRRSFSSRISHKRHPIILSYRVSLWRSAMAPHHALCCTAPGRSVG